MISRLEPNVTLLGDTTGSSSRPAMNAQRVRPTNADTVQFGRLFSPTRQTREMLTTLEQRAYTFMARFKNAKLDIIDPYKEGFPTIPGIRRKQPETITAEVVLPKNIFENKLILPTGVYVDPRFTMPSLPLEWALKARYSDDGVKDMELTSLDPALPVKLVFKDPGGLKPVGKLNKWLGENPVGPTPYVEFIDHDGSRAFATRFSKKDPGLLLSAAAELERKLVNACQPEKLFRHFPGQPTPPDTELYTLYKDRIEPPRLPKN